MVIVMLRKRLKLQGVDGRWLESRQWQQFAAEVLELGLEVAVGREGWWWEEQWVLQA